MERLYREMRPYIVAAVVVFVGGYMMLNIGKIILPSAGLKNLSYADWCLFEGFILVIRRLHVIYDRA